MMKKMPGCENRGIFLPTVFKMIKCKNEPGTAHQNFIEIPGVIYSGNG